MEQAPLDAALAATPDLGHRLRLIAGAGLGRLVFTTSFGLEDQVLLDALAGAGVEADIVTLDTGRLFPETLELWAESERRYRVRVRALIGAVDEVEADLARHGPMGFRLSRDARESCCRVRKVLPLGRALEGAGGWLTGLRAGQSAARGGVPFAAADPASGLVKLAPLADWSRADCEAYATRRGVPVNRLHARGYPSIGCAPCTRAVAVGEDERAGRWWWERDQAGLPDHRECGLHRRPTASARLPLAPADA